MRLSLSVVFVATQIEIVEYIFMKNCYNNKSFGDSIFLAHRSQHVVASS